MCVWILLMAIAAIARSSETDETLFLTSPTVTTEKVAFVYANDLWIAGRDGGEARRLTINPGVESNPWFSPDGQSIAFSGDYDGNTDVFVMPSNGGNPTRLTFHPGEDQVLGWTPDGQRILFGSGRDSATMPRFFTVSRDGGFPEPLPIPAGIEGSISPDGRLLAYNPVRHLIGYWKRYRGGQMGRIWILDLQSLDYTEIPQEKSNNINPLWIGDTVYFLSDRNHTMNLFSYDTKTQAVNQLTWFTDFDIERASAGDGVIALEQGGRLHIYNPADKSLKTLKIKVHADLPHSRPHFAKVVDWIQNADISPSGKRAVFEARGDIFTVPAEKGDIRNITRTPGVHERFPSWSPDGKWIAYFSDASGEYQLMIREQDGRKEPTVIPLGGPTFFYSPKWSPDSKKLVFTDKRLNLFYIDIEKKEPVLIDTDTYDHPVRSLDPVWAPDSRWITYTKRLDNHMRAVFVYDLENKSKHQITDGMSDCTSPCFSLDGKYLYFGASTSVALTVGWLDLSSLDRPVRRNLYIVVLNEKDPSPFAPESDEETVKEATDDISAATGKIEAATGDIQSATAEIRDASPAESKDMESKIKVIIDFENLSQRILAMPIPELTYTQFYASEMTKSIQTAAEGKVFYMEESPGKPGVILKRFDMKERKSEDFLDSVNFYQVSQNGKMLLYRAPGNKWAIVKTDGKPKPEDGVLKLDRLETQVDPQAEWAQIFEEFWRIERDFLYAPNMHGADWPAIREKYRPFLKYVGHRGDLNNLIGMMMGELVLGHMFVWGGDQPEVKRVPIGLLGADYEIVDGYYRFKKIYQGLNWNPDLRAPLTMPGVNVKEGDYLLAVDGRPLKAPTNIYSLFENTADKQTVLTVHSSPNIEEATRVTVVPIGNEWGLRNRAWVEGNRKKVEELSGGKAAYVYLPNTSNAGYEYFNRYYFAQLDRQAVVVDERFNGGGSVADYVVDLLDRPLLSYWATREGKMFKTPSAVLDGPRVMIINEFAGSGGDFLPMAFKRRGLGKLVGKTTWGGLVGIYDYPNLIDGGRVTAPRMAIVSPNGEWEVENVGVSPDIEVEMDPKSFAQGRDPQLEKAVEVVLQELAQNPPRTTPPLPPFPNRVK
ncbi:MAG: PDZ domain-containing protein [bacterium]